VKIAPPLPPPQKLLICFMVSYKSFLLICEMKVETYNLTDAELLDDNISIYRCMIWEPGFLCIVLGQSNDLERSVWVENVEADKIPVYKRPSGGETVVLSPDTMVISILKRGDGLRSPRKYFDTYNEQIISALRALGINNLAKDGISDIRIGDKKILGSSIYRDKDRVLYHAVLNRAEPADTIERYLKHPPREPGYRRGRTHRDFVASMTELGYVFPFETIKETILWRLSHR
jgi:lipoate-protein ligase A